MNLTKSNQCRYSNHLISISIFNEDNKNVTVPGKRPQVAHIMNFCIGGFSATTPKDTKLLCLSQRYLPLFANTHPKFESVEALIIGQVCCLKAAP